MMMMMKVQSYLMMMKVRNCSDGYHSDDSFDGGDEDEDEDDSDHLYNASLIIGFVRHTKRFVCLTKSVMGETLH